MNDPEIIGALPFGLKVYDASGEMVGTVDVVDREAGIMRVATDPFVEEAIVIPIRPDPEHWSARTLSRLP
jgi:hypothetical protein